MSRCISWLAAVLLLAGLASGCKRDGGPVRRAAAVPLEAVPADVHLAVDVDARVLSRFYRGLEQRLRARWPEASWIDLPAWDALRAWMLERTGFDLEKIERLALAVELDTNGVAGLALIASPGNAMTRNGKMHQARPVPDLALVATSPGLRDRVVAAATGNSRRALDTCPVWLAASAPDLDQLRVYLIRAGEPVASAVPAPIRTAGLFVHTARGASLVIEAAKGQGGPLHQQMVLRKMQARAQIDAMFRAATGERAAAARAAFQDVAGALDRIRLHRDEDRVTLSCRTGPKDGLVLDTIVALAARILAAGPS